MNERDNEIRQWVIKADHDFESFYDSVSELQGYAVEIRYPNETIFLSPEKVEESMIIAKDVRSLVVKKINLTIDYNKIIDK